MPVIGKGILIHGGKTCTVILCHPVSNLLYSAGRLRHTRDGSKKGEREEFVVVLFSIINALSYQFIHRTGGTGGLTPSPYTNTLSPACLALFCGTNGRDGADKMPSVSDKVTSRRPAPTSLTNSLSPVSLAPNFGPAFSPPACLALWASQFSLVYHAL